MGGQRRSRRMPRRCRRSSSQGRCSGAGLDSARHIWLSPTRYLEGLFFDLDALLGSMASGGGYAADSEESYWLFRIVGVVSVRPRGASHTTGLLFFRLLEGAVAGPPFTYADLAVSHCKSGGVHVLPPASPALPRAPAETPIECRWRSPQAASSLQLQGLPLFRFSVHPPVEVIVALA